MTTAASTFIVRPGAVGADPIYVDSRSEAVRLAGETNGSWDRVPAPIRYATSKPNTIVTAVRLGSKVDDTFRVTVYRDGVPETFTTRTARLAEIMAQLDGYGFTLSYRPNVGLAEAWVQ